jgi:PAS domain S-box-containing protein
LAGTEARAMDRQYNPMPWLLPPVGPRPASRPRWVTYGVAIAATAAATAIGLALRPYLWPPPVALFAAGVALAAWLGGLGPALAATALSIASQLLNVDPVGTELAIRLASFGAAGMLIGVGAESISRAHGQAADQAAALQDQAMELELLNQELTESIEEAQRSRDAAEAAEERYRMLFEQNPLPMWVYDLETLAFLAVNDAAVTHYGFGRDEFLRMTLRDIRPPEDLPALDESVRGGKPGLSSSGRFRHRRRDGEVISVEIHSHDLEFDGRPARLVLASDVTDRLRAEAALRATTERLQVLVDASPLPIVGLDPEGRVLTWNRAAEATFGWPASEVVGRGFPCFPADGEHQTRSFLAQVREGRASTGLQALCTRRDGERIEVHVSTAPLRDGHGAFVGVVAIYEDVTERRRTASALERSEEQLRQAQKMEAIGRLAGGVAHDFNNILTVIQSYAELLALELGPAGAGHGDLDEIRRAAERAAALTSQLLAFSRRQVLDPEVLDPNEVVRDTERMLRRLIGEDIELVTRLQPGVAPVLADAGQFTQVLLNLAVNARDAMPDGGRLLIETADVELDDVYARGHAGLAPGPHVVLSVTDTGLGMDAETRSRVFEPFFTTKAPGKGTGLGLSMVYGFVEQSGGRIWVYSEPGQGTTFKIHLPAAAEADPEPARAPRAAAHAPAHAGQATVLVVEDEEEVRKVVVRTLGEHGYTVLEAVNGREALAIAAERRGGIDLVLTDVVMPEMKGGELAEHLRREHPGVRLLMMSGYTEEEASLRAVLTAGTAFLEKPFTASRLLDKVRSVLEAG